MIVLIYLILGTLLVQNLEFLVTLISDKETAKEFMYEFNNPLPHNNGLVFLTIAVWPVLLVALIWDWLS